MFPYDERTLTTCSGVADAAALPEAEGADGAVLPPHAVTRTELETSSASVTRARTGPPPTPRMRRSIVIPFDHPCGSVGRERRRRPRLPPPGHPRALQPLGIPPPPARGRPRA